MVFLENRDRSLGGEGGTAEESDRACSSCCCPDRGGVELGLRDKREGEDKEATGEEGSLSGLLGPFSRGRTSLETEGRNPEVSSALRFLEVTDWGGVLPAPSEGETQIWSLLHF